MLRFAEVNLAALKARGRFFRKIFSNASDFGARRRGYCVSMARESREKEVVQRAFPQQLVLPESTDAITENPLGWQAGFPPYSIQERAVRCAYVKCSCRNAVRTNPVPALVRVVPIRIALKRDLAVPA